MIGGKKQDGPWGIDARYNKRDLIARIQRIARYRRRVSLYNLDAAEFISDTLPALNNAFVYLDPPYYGKGKDLYQHFYQHDDHAAIASLVPNIQQPWIVSYDSHSALLPLYGPFRSLHYRLSYSAQARYKGSEVVFFSPNLRIPEVSSPANIQLRDVIAAETTVMSD